MKSRRVRWVGHVAHMREIRNEYKIHEGKKPLGGPRPRWEDVIRMDHRETGWEGLDWIRLTKNMDLWQTLVNRVMNFLRS
jgi:hypothetical protein